MHNRRTWTTTLVHWLPALVWMAVIFWASSLPGTRIPGGYSVYGHFVEYAVLGGLLALPLRRMVGNARGVALAILIASLYGVTDELHQAFVPLRMPDVADWGVDTLGAFFGALVLAWIHGVLGRAARGRARQ